MRLKILFFLILGMWVLGTAALAEPVCTHVDMDWISQQVPLPPDTRIVFKQEQGALCEVVLAVNGELVPMYAGIDFIVVGKLFNNERFVTGETLEGLEDVAREERRKADEKEALEVEKRKAFFKIEYKMLDELSSFSFNPGKGRDILYVITDPDCSYCKELMPELEKVAMETEHELKVIIYPLLVPESREMAVQAICGEYSYKAYKEIQHQPETQSCDKAEALIEKTVSFFSSARLFIVPVVVAGDGSWVVEGSNIRQVKEHLGIETGDGDESASEGCGPAGDD